MKKVRSAVALIIGSVLLRAAKKRVPGMLGKMMGNGNPMQK